MEFRWAAAIALWTMLAGPLFHGIFQSGSRAERHRPTVVVRTVTPPTP